MSALPGLAICPVALDLTRDRRGGNLLAFVVMRRDCDRGYGYWRAEKDRS